MPWRCREMLPEHQLVHEDLFFFMLNSSLRRLLQRDLPSSDVTERPVVFPTRTSTFKSLDFAAYRLRHYLLSRRPFRIALASPPKCLASARSGKKKKFLFLQKAQEVTPPPPPLHSGADGRLTMSP